MSPTHPPPPTRSAIPDVNDIFATANDARDAAKEDRAGANEAEQDLRDKLTEKVGNIQAGASTDPEETARMMVAVSLLLCFLGG
jgi:hypothetical protein